MVLPLFRAKNIAWLPLEGLVRQKGVDFLWELIVAEEVENTHEPFGFKSIKKYSNLLHDVKCARITYLGLNEWIPLGKKLSMMIRECDDNSLVLARQAADMYPPPTRLVRQYKIFKERPDIHWVMQPKTIMYRIEDERTALIVTQTGRGDGCFNSIRMSLAKSIKPLSRKIVVDGEFIQGCHEVIGGDINFYINDDDSWKYGLNTHGMNNLSVDGYRDKQFDNLYSNDSRNTSGRWFPDPGECAHWSCAAIWDH